MFDLSKPYQRRDGIQCEIVKRLKQNKYLVVSVTGNGDDFAYEVYLDGKELLSEYEGRYDLVNIPKKIEGFLNIYKAKDGCIRVIDPLYSSRPEADEYAGGNRIACIFVSFEEGEGL